mmetsp:Transcript_96972/g.278625  ORF Transcript_96972/g.278625 Transcript_96972/m.278625 type:complete len:222 (-) Transcript_96972:148-813(-)
MTLQKWAKSEVLRIGDLESRLSRPLGVAFDRLSSICTDSITVLDAVHKFGELLTFFTLRIGLVGVQKATQLVCLLLIDLLLFRLVLFLLLYHPSIPLRLGGLPMLRLLHRRRPAGRREPGVAWRTLLGPKCSSESSLLLLLLCLKERLQSCTSAVASVSIAAGARHSTQARQCESRQTRQTRQPLQTLQTQSAGTWPGLPHLGVEGCLVRKLSPHGIQSRP